MPQSWKPDPTNTKSNPEKPVEEFARNNEVRKSKTKRVKSYLKKCKDAVTANTKNTNENAGSSWYVPPTTAAPPSPPKIVESISKVVTIDKDEVWETCDDLEPSDKVSLYQIKNSEIVENLYQDLSCKSDLVTSSILDLTTVNDSEVAEVIEDVEGVIEPPSYISEVSNIVCLMFINRRLLCLSRTKVFDHLDHFDHITIQIYMIKVFIQTKSTFFPKFLFLQSFHSLKINKLNK